MNNDIKNAVIAWAIGCACLYALGKVAPGAKNALMSASGMAALPAGSVAVTVGTPTILPSGSVTVGA